MKEKLIQNMDIRALFSELYQELETTKKEDVLWDLFVKAQEQRVGNLWRKKITRFFKWINSEERETI